MITRKVLRYRNYVTSNMQEGGVKKTSNMQEGGVKKFGTTDE